MAPRMSLLPLICSLSGETLMVRVSTGKCMARGVTMAVTLFASRSRIACASSGCSRASPYLRNIPSCLHDMHPNFLTAQKQPACGE